jgi:hypothetical protein
VTEREERGNKYMKQNPKLDICIYIKITAEICKKVKVYNIIEEVILHRNRLNDYF